MTEAAGTRPGYGSGSAADRHAGSKPRPQEPRAAGSHPAALDRRHVGCRVFKSAGTGASKKNRAGRPFMPARYAVWQWVGPCLLDPGSSLAPNAPPRRGWTLRSAEGPDASPAVRRAGMRRLCRPPGAPQLVRRGDRSCTARHISSAGKGKTAALLRRAGAAPGSARGQACQRGQADPPPVRLKRRDGRGRRHARPVRRPAGCWGGAY